MRPPSGFPVSCYTGRGIVRTGTGCAALHELDQRDAHPEDLIGALVFLASAEGDFAAGQTPSVCGGTVNT